MTVYPRFQKTQIVKIGRLMDMLYKPVEIAEELDTTADTIVRTWIPAGLPLVTDSRGKKWINGRICAEWIKRQTTRKSIKKKMPDNHGYCFSCRKAVPMNNYKVVDEGRNIEMRQAPCPKCGKSVNRVYGKNKRPNSTRTSK